MQYLDDLIEDCKAAKKAKPLKKFIMGELNELKNIKSAIYIITEIDADPIATYEAFRVFRVKKECACAKLNHPSSTLYVGSSTTGVMNRIKQHFGNGHKYKSTSALHLSHWAEDRKIKVEIMEYDVPRKIIQLIEDAISTELKPAFGKLGGNNK